MNTASLGTHSDLMRFSRVVTIRDKMGQIVPLIPTPAQQKLYEAIVRMEDKGQPIRVVVLKARQVHMSVAATLVMYHRLAFWPGQTGMVVGHLVKTTRNLFRYWSQFIQSYSHPEIEQAPLASELPNKVPEQPPRIHWANDSYVDFQTAGTTDAGRSFSIRHVHLSELAFYRDAPELLTGLMQSIPSDMGTTVIVESTANGASGPFFDLWQRETSPDANTGWLPVFFSWLEHPEYMQPPGGTREADLLSNPVHFERSFTPEERTLRDNHGVTFGQLAWRRWCIGSNCEGYIDRFHQEYPTTPEEAFISSGRPVFDTRRVYSMPVIREVTTADLVEVEVGTRVQIQARLREDGRGALRIFRRPEPNHRYTLGADVAEGIDAKQGKERGAADPDYCVGQVLDKDSGEQVAIWRARISPAGFAGVLFTLGKYYNWAFLVPEVNAGGLGTLEELLRLAYPLRLIYTRRRMADDRHSPALEELGWKTTTVSKPQLVSTLDKALMDRSITVHDQQTVRELLAFVFDERGKTGAEYGQHDDCVIALALAVVGILTYPREQPRETAVERMGKFWGAKRQRDEDD